jgi:hypothetical protein
VRRLFGIGAITGLLVAITSICFATSNLNLSKSNINRLVCSNTLVTQAQAASILAKLDTIGRGAVVDEATLRRILQDNGVPVGRIQKIIIRPADKTRKNNLFIVLENPADAAEALAISDPRPLDPKGVPPPPRPFDPKGLPVPPPPRPFDPKGLEGR